MILVHSERILFSCAIWTPCSGWPRLAAILRGVSPLRARSQMYAEKVSSAEISVANVEQLAQARARHQDSAFCWRPWRTSAMPTCLPSICRWMDPSKTAPWLAGWRTAGAPGVHRARADLFHHPVGGDVLARLAQEGNVVAVALAEDHPAERTVACGPAVSGIAACTTFFALAPGIASGAMLKPMSPPPIGPMWGMWMCSLFSCLITQLIAETILRR